MGTDDKSATPADFIKNQEEVAFLSGEVDQGGLSTHVKVRIYPQGKKIFLDDKLAKSTEALQNILPIIVFSPADHRIIDGDSADRKQFLNRAAANVDWEYLEDFLHYNKVLAQRNRILKDAGRPARFTGRAFFFGSLRLCLGGSDDIGTCAPAVRAKQAQKTAGPDGF